MKSLIFAAAAISLLSLATAKPHAHRHVHQRADVTDYVTVTVTAPEVVVWVDDQGNTVSIETRTNSIAASTPAPILTPSVSDTPSVVTPASTQSVAFVSPSELPSSFFALPAPVTTETPTTPPTAPAPVESAPAPAPPPAAKEAPTSAPATPTSDAPPAGSKDGPPSAHPVPPAPPPSVPVHSAPTTSGTQGASHQAQSGGMGFGITWSPYNHDSTCKSQDQAISEFAQLAGTGFTMVRIYGVDCNQVAMTIAAVAPYNMVVFAGLTGLDSLVLNLASMISQVGPHWDMINTVSIGNELINNNLAAVGDVVAALATARATLNLAGFAGRIVTVDVYNQILAHPELCQASDYCAANCHAFFDDQINADQAGNYVSGIHAQISQQFPGKDVMITESGWPWAGSLNGAAVPSVVNQQTAIASLRSAFVNGTGSLILFDSFDTRWKQPGAYGVEQHFGIYGR